MFAYFPTYTCVALRCAVLYALRCAVLSPAWCPGFSAAAPNTHPSPASPRLLNPPCSLGAMYATQLYQAAEKTLPGLSDDIVAGKFGRLKSWLNEKVHR